MMKKEKKTRILVCKIEELEEEGTDKKELDKLWTEMGKVALGEGNVYWAKRAFMKLKDQAGLKKVGDLGLKTGHIPDALEAYRLIGDEEGLRKGIETAVRGGDLFSLKSVISKKVISKNGEAWLCFLEKKGFSSAAAFRLEEIINAAHQLAPGYDYGIGIAKGGLYSSYIFSLFGLPEIMAEAHKARFYGKDVVLFKWLDPPERIENKKILVFDKDVISGRTLKKALKEIQKYSPQQVDLFLNHSPVKQVGPTIEIGSKMHNAPEGFRKIFYPGMMDYTDFYGAVVQLQGKLGIQWGP